MTTWLTSDEHYGHANIIGYSGRPFRDLDHMHEELVRRHNERVKPEDLVIHLGDFSIRECFAAVYLPKLNGRHALVAGNHDACHPRWSRRNVGAHDRYLGYGFIWVREELRLYRPEHGLTLLLHHMPYSDPVKVEKYADWRPQDHGSWLLHGHVHEAWKVSGRQLNVGVDQWGWAPVSLAEVCEYIRIREEMFDGQARTD
jgi:calcineurin-like phosphoesterase family protein